MRCSSRSFIFRSLLPHIMESTCVPFNSPAQATESVVSLFLVFHPLPPSVASDGTESYDLFMRCSVTACRAVSCFPRAFHILSRPVLNLDGRLCPHSIAQHKQLRVWTLRFFLSFYAVDVAPFEAGDHHLNRVHCSICAEVSSRGCNRAPGEGSPLSKA